MENYALGALVSCDMEPANPGREVANPANKKVTREIRILPRSWPKPIADWV